MRCDLPGIRQRQGLAKLQNAGTLAVGELASKPTEQLVCFNRLTLLEDDEGFGLLAQFRVRHTDDGGETDGRVLMQDQFYLHRVDALIAAQDLTVRPSIEEQIAFVVECPIVPSAVSSISNSVGGGVAHSKISLHEPRAADDDLALLARGNARTLLVDDPHIDARDPAAILDGPP